MSGTVNKIVFSALAAFLLLLLSIGACSYWVRQTIADVEKVKPQAQAEGAEFGRGTDEYGCVQEAIARSKKDQSVTGTALSRFFLDGCLKTSQATPGFCNEVPKWDDRFNSKTWALAVCEDFGRSDNYCAKVLEHIPPYCDRVQPYR